LNQNLRYWNDLVQFTRMLWIRYLMTFLLSFLCFQTTYCQEWIYKDLFPSGDFGNMEFNSILYGSEGFLYLGTTEGLFKTDGFIKSLVPLSDSLKVQSITSLAEYPTGELLIGTASGLILKIRKTIGKQEYIASIGAEIKDILISAENDIWLATYGKGLYHLTDSLRIINTSNGLLDNYCYCLETDAVGRIWVGTDRGINIISEDGSVTHSITGKEGLPDVLVTALYLDNKARMWVGMESAGICYLDTDPGPEKVTQTVSSWEHGMVSDLLLSGQNIIIATSEDGIFELKDIMTTQSFEFEPWSVSSGLEVIGMVQDHHGNIIVLTPEEVILTPGDALQLWTSRNGFQFQDIHALHIDNEARLWFSMYNSLYTMDPGSKDLPLKVFETTPTSSIISLYEDPFHNLWAGTFGEGLYIINKQTFQSRHLEQSDGLPDENIISLTGDSVQVWLATLGGVATCPLLEDPIKQPVTITQLDIGQNSGLDINFLYDIHKDSVGNLWFATDGSGIVSSHNGNTQTYLGENEPGRQVILAITGDSRGNLWFASATDGLYRYDGSDFLHFGPEEGLRDPAITTIILDREDNLLILHKSGIDILDTEKGSFSYLDPFFGNQKNEFFLNAVGRDPHGNIWLGSEKGIVRFAALPDAFFEGPKTIINRVKIFYEDFDFRNNNRLDYRQNHIIFHFSAIWYQHPEAVTFQYQMEPDDPGWFTTSSREISYSGLAPGQYTFKVRSGVNMQFGQASLSTYEFTILRPFFKQWWFLLLIILALSSLFIFTLRIRERNIKKREQDARELVILQFETLKNQVNPHFLFNSLNTLVSMIRQDKDIATEYVENLAEYFRNILTFKNIDLIPMSEELALMETYYYLQQKRYGENLKLDLELDKKATDSLIPPLTLQILLENALKHNEVSSRRPLTIKILSSDDTIVVENNLQLKMNAEASTRTGLDNIKNRYRLASGKEVREENDGSYFRIFLPLIIQVHESTVNRR